MVTLINGKLVCSDCGGACAATTTNYDQVMHLEGCSRLRELTLWGEHSYLLALSTNVNPCGRDFREGVSRSCPAVKALLGVISGLSLPVSRRCDCSGECYARYCEELEEETIELAEQLAQ